MQRLSDKTSRLPERLLLFPVLSLLCHLVLFFIALALPGPDLHQNKAEETLLAIVDLSTLNLPEPDLSEASIEADPALPSAEKFSLSEKLSLPEKFSLNEPGQGDASLLPASESGTGPIDLAQLTGGDLKPPPPPLAMEAPVDDSVPEQDEAPPEKISELAPPEPEAADLPAEEERSPDEAASPDEAEGLEGEAIVETGIEEPLEVAEPAPPEEVPEAVLEPAPAETPSKPAISEPAVEETVASQVVAEAVEAPEQDSPAEAVTEAPIRPEALKLAAVKKPVEQKRVKPEKPLPPPPSSKPSKEKIKKVGLLGLLKKGTNKTTRKRSLLAKRFPRKRKTLKKLRKQHLLSKPVGLEEGITRLKREVLGSEQQRLLKRRALSAHRRPAIEIVQGGGRNYKIVSSAIRKKSNALATVYSRLLLQSPTLQGNVLVEFEISPEGRVTKCTILTSSLGNAQFEKKLVQEILHWTFRPTKKGKTTVLYPLSFFPSGS